MARCPDCILLRHKLDLAEGDKDHRLASCAEKDAEIERLIAGVDEPGLVEHQQEALDRLERERDALRGELDAANTVIVDLKRARREEGLIFRAKVERLEAALFYVVALDFYERMWNYGDVVLAVNGKFTAAVDHLVVMQHLAELRAALIEEAREALSEGGSDEAAE